MAQRCRTRQVGEIEWRQVGDSDYAVPRSITMQIGDQGEELPFHVEITVENDGDGPACTRLVLEQKPAGGPVTSEGLREIPVRELTKFTAGMLVAKINDRSEPLTSANVSLLDDLGAVDDAVQAVEGEERAKRRRITDDDLRQLADIVTLAEASDRSYIAMAGLRMGLSPDQARQWKRKAIQSGFLPATKGSKR